MNESIQFVQNIEEWMSYHADYLLTSQKRSDFPLPMDGFIWDAGKTLTMEDSSKVDDHLLIINPGSNDGNRQQK